MGGIDSCSFFTLFTEISESVSFLAQPPVSINHASMHMRTSKKQQRDARVLFTVRVAMVVLAKKIFHQGLMKDHALKWSY